MAKGSDGSLGVNHMVLGIFIRNAIQVGAIMQIQWPSGFLYLLALIMPLNYFEKQFIGECMKAQSPYIIENASIGRQKCNYRAALRNYWQWV